MNAQTPLKIIGISGKQFTGKDVLADILTDQLPGFKKLPLALAIKEAYAAKQGVSLAEIEQNKPQRRPGLIAMGDWGRKQDPHYWLKLVMADPQPKIISDVRLKREYDFLKENGAFLIRLNADRDIRAERGKIVSENDPTECELDSITDWDAVLSNNGEVQELRMQVAKMLISSGLLKRV